MLGIFNRFLDLNRRETDRLSVLVGQITALEPEINKLKDDDFPSRIDALKNRLSSGDAALDDVLVEVFALVREAAVRTIGQRPYDVQLMAGVTFHQGKIAEQKTGEGKTLSASAALVLNALTGRGAHLVTVNDYLARVGAGWMAPVYHFLGLSTGVIYSGEGNLPAAIYDPAYNDPTHTDDRLRHLKPVSRKEAYQADITYGTNNEFGFDYLRDNMAQSLSAMVQRGHHYAIVDEVDSILIDEARTPLIISAPDTDPTDKYLRFASVINSLSADIDYEIDEKLRTANLTDHGLRKLEKMLGVDNLYEKDFDTVHHVEQALKAKTLFTINRDYVVKDGQIIIVDEHTGRLMYGRRFSEGLHQAIEAKEGVTVQQESRTLATISLQNFFRMYTKLSGMTGTAETEAEEFKKIYGLEVVVIPTHRPVARTDHADQIYKTTRAKYAAIIHEVAERHQAGQPILLGTKSIEQNDIVAGFLKKKKIPHQVLNAKNHEKEAQIIADAGRLGAVTVATNIAGRGVDIILGGSKQDRDEKDWQKEHEDVIKAGGLHVIGTVRHESRRIDNQLRGRSGRQGDPGSSRFYVSLEDDIMRIFGGDQVKRLMDILKVPEDQPLEAAMVDRALETAQSKVESFYSDQRKRVVEYDDVMNKQREVIYTRRRQVLEDADNNPKRLHQHLLDLLNSQLDLLTGMLASSGITDSELDLLVQNFCLILPLDSKSQDTLKEFITNNPDADKVNDHLKKLVTQVVDSRKAQLGDQLDTEIERFVMLSTIDQYWMDHLDALDHLRDGIGLRGFAHQDPLVEYKQEAFSMFERLLSQIDATVTQRLFRVQVKAPQPDPTRNAVAVKADPNGLLSDVNNRNIGLPAKAPQRGAKVGRNDPCPCGSGLKYKKCGMIGAPQHRA